MNSYWYPLCAILVILLVYLLPSHFLANVRSGNLTLRSPETTQILPVDAKDITQHPEAVSLQQNRSWLTSERTFELEKRAIFSKVGFRDRASENV